MSSPPTTLGQYQIIREIARSNDIVYEAYDPLMNRRVAVKELAMPAGMTDPQKDDRISRFKREAQAAGTLNHANIMTVYSFAEESGRTFMAMEYLDGHTLRNEIDTKGFVPIDRAIEIAIDVLEGLGHAHSKGVIHRDIKPDNIQILSSGQVKITDFGIARLTFQPNLTMDGQVFGTPSYMSPEQVVGRDIDARSDLFSVAVVLYEMVCGQKPFAGDSVVSITYAIMNKEPQHPTQCTWSLWQVLSRALDKSPQLRYSNAAEMVEALRNAERQAKSGTMGGTTAVAPPPVSYSQQPYAPDPYANNPYGQPIAPPIVSPYATPPSPYPTAYNPYQPQAVQTPYGYAPPVQNQPPGMQYPQMPMMPPPGPIPVYYPPPPRAPLLKPDTVIFLRKLAITFALLGTLLALVLVGVQSCANFVGQRGNAEADARTATDIANLNDHMPIEERVQQAEAWLGKLPVEARSQSAHNTAVLYETLGKQRANNQDLPKAELAFKRGIELDRDNSALNSDLADLYGRQASVQTDLDQSITLFRVSGEQWTLASNSEMNPSKRTSYSEAAARSFYKAAYLMKGQDGATRQSIIAMLGQAQQAAPTGALEIRQQIQDLLREVNNG